MAYCPFFVSEKKMNFWVATLLVVAAVLLICPAGIAGKKYQKDEHEKKVFTRTSLSSDSKTIHHVKHPKEREVLIRSTRGAKASENSPAGIGDTVADNAAPGKEKKNKKNHKKTPNQSQQLPLSLTAEHDSSELPSPANNNKHNRNSNLGQSERHQSKFNKRKQQNSENTHDTKKHSKNSEGGNNARKYLLNTLLYQFDWDKKLNCGLCTGGIFFKVLSNTLFLLVFSGH